RPTMSPHARAICSGRLAPCDRRSASPKRETSAMGEGLSAIHSPGGPEAGMLKSHGRYDYSAMSRRPDYSWPDCMRLSVHFSFTVEHFAFGEGLGNDYAAPTPSLQPSVRAYAWRDYGNRVGAWRLLDLAQTFDLPYALLTNTELYDYCPEMIKAFSERG